MMNKKSIVTLALAAVVAMSAVTTSAFAAPTVRRVSDFGISYVKQSGSGAVTGAATRYDGADYTATLAEMEAKRDAARAQGTQVGAPTTVTITATSTADAEAQIEQALEYVPDTIQVTLNGVPSGEVDAFYSRYANWMNGTQDIDLFIRAIQTEDSKPLTVTRNGNTLTFSLVYAEGWLAYADTQDWLKVFANEDYSEALVDFAEKYLDPIAEQELSEAETFAQIAKTLRDTTSYDYNTKSYTNGSDDFLKIHSMYGAITGDKVVCDGYSYTVQFMASYLDLYSFECYGPNHAWNKVRVDGQWYVLDMTQIEASYWLMQNWFLISDKYQTADQTTNAGWVYRLYDSPESHPDRISLANATL